MTEIEKIFSATLSQWYRIEVMVFFRGDLQLEAVAYNSVGGVIMQRLIDFTTTRGFGTLQKNLEESLAKAALLKQTRSYKYYEKELRWGEITACDRENNLYVEIEVIPGEKITAVCPHNRRGLHERDSNKFSIGERRAFHLRRIDPVALKGTSRLKVVVDRVSKTLVETLLYDYLDSSVENISLHCTNRYVGQKSFVFTSKRLPKAVIVAVTRELREHIEVRFLGNS
jgi:hypothetical protein